MNQRRLLLTASAICLVLAGARSQTADQILIASRSAWRYNDSGANLGTAWRGRTYNDAAWASGPAQLGYGDGDEATVISYGSNPNNRRITYYFRQSFSVTNPSTIASLVVRFVRDDGCVIYVNGVEVARSNMPSGTITYTTRASTAIGGGDESAWLEAQVDPAVLVSGTNVVAVEVHQQSPTSSDVSFDLELRGVPAQVQAPTATLVTPTDHSVTNTGSVTFTAAAAAAAGLSNASLYIGDPPMTVVFSGPAQVQDAQITADTPTLADGAAVSLNVDGLTPHAHALMKLPSLIGSGAGQVPAGVAISSATLLLNCTNPGQTMRMYRLTQDWIEDQATWNERATGVVWASAGADGAGSNAGVAVNGDCTATGQRTIDLTTFVQEWTNGQPNYGIVFIESGTDGVDFTSSESGTSPALTVLYKTGQQLVETKSVSGTTAQVSFSTSLTIGRTYLWNVRVTDVAGQQSWAPSEFELTVDAASPDAPMLVSPADGATGVELTPNLQTAVGDPAGGMLTVSVGLREAVAPEFTIIALPDTQHYSEAFPAIYTSQTQWIVINKTARNIVFVTHEGDIVEHYGLASEWQAANASMSLLDGVVPYGMGPGNHDQPTTLFNQYFPYTRYQGLSWYGGHFQNLNDNNFQLFSGGGIDFVIVHLEFCPPAAAVAWADSVLKAYPDRIGIMTTHGYLGLQAQRSVHSCTDTQYLWDGLAVPNPNLHFMLSGHVHGESRRTDTANGHDVFQLLADFQDRPSGGEGWLRILRFVPAENKVYVQTYSPWLNRFESDADSEFTLDFPMGGAFLPSGTSSVQSGATGAFPVSGLRPNAQYEWQATVTNSSGKTRVGPVWRFTTGSGATNQPPVASNQSVTVQEDASANVTLTAVDPEDSPLTFTVVSGPAHGTLTGSGPSRVYQPTSNFNGSDSFTFRANDGQANSNLATVAIDVQAQNDPPVAVGESYSVTSGAVLAVNAPGVLGNDSDIDSGSLQAQLVAGPAHGAITLNANGSFSYASSAGYSGPDSFSYAASDGQATSGAAVVGLTVTPGSDTTAPLVTMTSPAAGATVSGTITITANASDDVGVSGVQFLLDGAPVGAEDTVAPYSLSWNSASVANGIHQLSARARDAASNQATATAVSVTVANAANPPGLVAAYSFNEGSGTTLTDRSGNGRTGTLSGSSWTTLGKFGGALSFDGVNDWVTVADANALDLTTGMTLEAWVFPTANGSGSWRTVLIKERTGAEIYSLYANADTNTPAVYVVRAFQPSAPLDIRTGTQLPLNAWRHLTATYDGATLRLYVDGTQVGSRAVSGSLLTSTGALRIGGNSVWGEFFQGRIDDVRIYNRALSIAEIQADMNAPVQP